MKHFTVGQFMKSCGAEYFGPREILDREIQGVVVDSRKVEKDFLFVASVGERVDGHRFIPEVYEKGALCAVSQQKLEHSAGPYLLVRDSLQALKDGAEAYRKTFDIPVIGVTGSVGKTSTKEMIASVLSQKYQVLKTPGNFNNEIGLPLTIFMIDKRHEAAVLEMGINHFGEMHRLSKMARPTHCVFTNIGVAHMEFLGSRDGILKAKCEMLDHAAPNAPIFVNGDDDKLEKLKERAQTFGLKKTNQIYADEIENLGLAGVRCRIHTPSAAFEAMIPVPGMHMVYNALAGACVGLSLDLTPEQIRSGMETLEALGGRGRILHTPLYTLLDDCYNANPVSMCAELDVLNLASARKVAVLGDMGELGAEAGKLHASVGEHLKELQIDLLITVGSLSKEIHHAALQSAPWTKCLHYADRDSFLNDAESVLQKGDSILIKASHSCGFEQIVKILQKTGEKV